VKKLSELLAQVRDEQSYIVMRERTHRNTAESTNGRVKWWSIFQLGVLIGEGIFQVWWLKRFFEVSCSSTSLSWVMDEGTKKGDFWALHSSTYEWSLGENSADIE
jgi:hypothetical protein